MKSTFDFDSFIFLLKGTLTTLKIFIGTVLVSLLIGTCIGLVCSKQLRIFFVSSVLDLFTFFIRAIPSFVLVLFVFFALPHLTNVSLPIEVAAIIALGINASCFVSQIIKSGIDSIEPGQWEAAYICGFSRLSTLKHIIFPQLIKNSSLVLVSEYTHMIKSTSAIAALGVLEVTKNGMKLVSDGQNPVIVYSLVGLIYILISLALVFLARVIKRKMNHDAW